MLNSRVMETNKTLLKPHCYLTSATLVSTNKRERKQTRRKFEYNFNSFNLIIDGLSRARRTRLPSQAAVNLYADIDDVFHLL